LPSLEKNNNTKCTPAFVSARSLTIKVNIDETVIKLPQTISWTVFYPKLKAFFFSLTQYSATTATTHSKVYVVKERVFIFLHFHTSPANSWGEIDLAKQCQCNQTFLACAIV
jgi:hypothetical protein